MLIENYVFFRKNMHAKILIMLIKLLLVNLGFFVIQLFSLQY